LYSPVSQSPKGFNSSSRLATRRVHTEVDTVRFRARVKGLTN